MEEHLPVTHHHHFIIASVFSKISYRYIKELVQIEVNPKSNRKHGGVTCLGGRTYFLLLLSFFVSR